MEHTVTCFLLPSTSTTTRVSYHSLDSIILISPLPCGSHYLECPLLHLIIARDSAREWRK